MKPTRFLTGLALMLAPIPAATAAVLVTPTSVTSSTADFFPVGQLIDNSGFAGTVTLANYSTTPHATGTPNNTMWVTVDPNPGTDYFVGGGAAPVLTIALGGSFQLTDFIYWGYANFNEAKDFTLTFSTTGTGGTFSGGQSFIAPSQINNGNPRTFALAPVTANAVRITITDNFSGDRVGLGEVKFIAVPEPSASLLGVIGALALLRRRR